ncbi:MAG: hypothetical protein KI793_24330 [Rivularia sp. (in: Bacteria)]|nr:hypothetical protein [Rivularia sp. MS3]
MKLIQKLSISLFAATASILSLSSGAFAGEGGAAGAAAFTIDDTGSVTGVAVAASVGKNDASAAAFNNVDGNFNSAFALGSAGVIDMQGIGDPDAAAMTGADDPDLSTAQANDLTGSATIQLGSQDGDVIATIPDSGTTTAP